MKHISEFRKDKGYSFDGYRVTRAKKGIVFCKYIPIEGNWDDALKTSIEIERELCVQLSKLNSYEELITFRNEWK